MANRIETANTTLTHYVVDPGASRFTVRAFASGLLSAVGHNPTLGIRTFTGEVTFSREALQAGEFRLTIQAASLSVQDDISAKDSREIERMMNDQVLETAKYPQIVYEAPTVSVTKLADTFFSAGLDGTLTLHGLSRHLPVTARIALFGSMLRASGDFTLNQTDFGIRLVSVAGGALKVKDQVKFSFDIVAREKE